MRDIITSVLLCFSVGFLSGTDAQARFSDFPGPYISSKNGTHPMDDRPVLVFDFGGVIGGTDRQLVAEALSPLLDISVAEAKALVAQLRTAKEQGLPPAGVWKDYETASGKTLPENWEEQYEQIRMVSIRANRQMLHYVDSLRQNGYRVALLSNTTVSRAEFIRRQGFYHHFEPVVLSCNIGAKKPKEEAFIFLLNQLGVTSGDCIIIDDKPVNIEAARRLGLDGIVFTTLDELERELEKRGVYGIGKN